MHRNIYEGRLQNVCHCNLQRTREPPSESTPLHSSLAVHYPLFSINIFALAAVCAVSVAINRHNPLSFLLSSAVKLNHSFEIQHSRYEYGRQMIPLPLVAHLVKLKCISPTVLTSLLLSLPLVFVSPRWDQ